MSGLWDAVADNAVYVVLGVVLFALFFLALNGAMDDGSTGAPEPNGTDAPAEDAPNTTDGGGDATDGGDTDGDASVDDGGNETDGSGDDTDGTDGTADDGGTNDTTAETDGATAESLNVSEVETLLVAGIDDERNASNVTGLERVENGSLHEMAAYHTEDMVTKDYFALTSPGGEEPEDRFESFAPDCSADDLLELVGRADTTAGGELREPSAVAEAILEGWLADHRDTVVAANRSMIGVAAAGHPDRDELYVTADIC